MERSKKINKVSILDEELGLFLRQLEEIENFYPCYRSMVKKEDLK